VPKTRQQIPAAKSSGNTLQQKYTDDYFANRGSSTPASAKPLARNWQAGHSPQGGTLPL